MTYRTMARILNMGDYRVKAPRALVEGVVDHPDRGMPKISPLRPRPRPFRRSIHR